MCRYIERSVPKNVRVQVHHFHQGNSSRSQRHGYKYVTECTLRDSEGTIIAAAKASCSPHDNPRRDVGRQVAIGRALKQLQVGAQ